MWSEVNGEELESYLFGKWIHYEPLLNPLGIHFPRFIIQQHSANDGQGADPAVETHGITEQYDRQPDQQGPFDRVGDTKSIKQIHKLMK